MKKLMALIIIALMTSFTAFAEVRYYNSEQLKEFNSYQNRTDKGYWKSRSETKIIFVCSTLNEAKKELEREFNVTDLELVNYLTSEEPEKCVRVYYTISSSPIYNGWSIIENNGKVYKL